MERQASPSFLYQARLTSAQLYIIHKEDGDLLTREMLEARPPTRASSSLGLY